MDCFLRRCVMCWPEKVKGKARVDGNYVCVCKMGCIVTQKIWLHLCSRSSKGVRSAFFWYLYNLPGVWFRFKLKICFILSLSRLAFAESKKASSVLWQIRSLLQGNRGLEENCDIDVQTWKIYIAVRGVVPYIHYFIHTRKHSTHVFIGCFRGLIAAGRLDRW